MFLFGQSGINEIFFEQVHFLSLINKDLNCCLSSSFLVFRLRDLFLVHLKSTASKLQRYAELNRKRNMSNGKTATYYTTYNNYGDNNQISRLENNSIHSSVIHAGNSTVQNSLVPTNLRLRQYWSNLSSVRPTDTKFDRLNREIYYNIITESQTEKISFDEIDLVWKMFTDTFEISKDPIDEKNCSALPQVSDETSLSFKCRYDGFYFGLRIHIKSLEKFLDEHGENLNQSILIFILDCAVEKVLGFQPSDQYLEYIFSLIEKTGPYGDPNLEFWFTIG